MSDQLTPMMAQYRRLRAGLPPDTILFFRLGDFYEMFGDDAIRAAGILDIALTRRQAVPMCGVPYHAADSYIAKLLAAGLKVAVCDQLEDPATARGLVRRDITRVVTPGARIEDELLESRQHNWMAALCRGPSGWGLAMLELSTGEFWVEESPSPDPIRELLAKYRPAELVVPDDLETLPWAAPASGSLPVLTRLDAWRFDPPTARDTLLRHFGVVSLDGFDCENAPAAVAAAGAVLHYVIADLRRNAAHIRTMARRRLTDDLALDEATVANLELVASRSGPSGPCLLRVLDVTCTPMGTRRMREWLLRPLANRAAIEARQEVVSALVARRDALRRLREALSGVRDIERIVARLGGGGTARDARALADSLRRLPDVRAAAASLHTPLADQLAADVDPMPDLLDRIDRTLVDEPPAALREGGLIRAGFHAELDELRRAAAEGRDWVARFQAREQQRTGIRSLKVRHNRVFGYYIEVTRANLGSVPPDYIRKQTLANGERFVTPELKEYENRILGAQQRAVELEYELFQQLRAAIVERSDALLRAAAAVATLDVLAAFADRAISLRYVRPRLHEGDRLWIRAGRHPVIETLPDAERFVPNDTLLDTADHQIAIITGPNMAGKSTYIRQVALITILAHAGAFVPADEADIPLTDRVFTRVGAGDDLARGRSTFMVEMQETANILNHATPRSLIVLDEIGRGTSTFDGISLAWAVAEYLHNTPTVKAKTLFATHYHELTDLALTLPGVKNYNVRIREAGDRIVFLRRIEPGAADKSYGIHVARLAGLPPAVIERAQEILVNLEEGEFAEAGQPRLARRRSRRPAADGAPELPLFRAGGL
ncbi:MAG: DNA mismatch repair protein MutS [Kiritimatiellae bacterium]|nr:DNA mismatch repair protein MutS [Kiritimatiellia bacterium]